MVQHPRSRSTYLSSFALATKAAEASPYYLEQHVVTAETTSSPHNMASSTLSSRLLVGPYLENTSRLSVCRQLLPIQTHDLLATAIAPQSIAATIDHLKNVSARGYRRIFKRGNTDLITSPLSTMTFYCLVAFLSFHTKTVTLYTAHQLGFAVSFVMLLETYDTIHAMMMRSEFTSERIRTVDTHLLCASGPQGLLIPSFGMAPDSDLHHEYSPGMDYVQEDNAAREKQHKKERSTSNTKLKQHNPFSPEDLSALKADDHTKRQQDNTIPYVLNTAPQHKSSKTQPITHKSLPPDLNIDQEPNMKPAEVYLYPQTTEEMQPSESTFQQTLRNSMLRGSRPRRTKSSRTRTSANEYPTSDSYFNSRSRTTEYSDSEATSQKSGISTPTSESSTFATESDFQAALRMMLSSSIPIKRRERKRKRSPPSIADESESSSSNQESDFQTRFREAVWPGCSSKTRG